MTDQHLRVSEIKKIRVRCTSVTKIHVGWDYVPEGLTSAQMNLPYSYAVMALDGDAFVDQFTDQRIKDPAILEFIKRIEVVSDPELDRLDPDYRHAAICEVETNDGRLFEKGVEFAKGGSTHPLGIEEVVSKFRRLAGKVLSKKKVEDLYPTVQDIEKLTSVKELTRFLIP